MESMTVFSAVVYAIIWVTVVMFIGGTLVGLLKGHESCKPYGEKPKRDSDWQDRQAIKGLVNKQKEKE